MTRSHASRAFQLPMFSADATARPHLMHPTTTMGAATGRSKMQFVIRLPPIHSLAVINSGLHHASPTRQSQIAKTHRATTPHCFVAITWLVPPMEPPVGDVAKTGLPREVALSRPILGDGLVIGPAEGSETVHEDDADLDFGALAIGLSCHDPVAGEFQAVHPGVPVLGLRGCQADEGFVRPGSWFSPRSGSSRLTMASGGGPSQEVHSGVFPQPIRRDRSGLRPVGTLLSASPAEPRIKLLPASSTGTRSRFSKASA